MTAEQFEQAKREFIQKYGYEWTERGYEGKPLLIANITTDLNALLDKQREVMCTQCREQYKAVVSPGRPDPRDVNPYDIRSVYHARNPRKRT